MMSHTDLELVYFWLGVVATLGITKIEFVGKTAPPLLNLAIIDQLHLLQQRFVEVLIPPVVLAELKPGTDYPGTERIQHALDALWLRVVELKDDTLARALRLELDQGEAAAIATAIELSHTQIVMDERDGRAKAKALGLQPVGILGVLLRAKLAGQIPSVETSLRALKNEAGFFIDDELDDGVLIEAGEK